MTESEYFYSRMLPTVVGVLILIAAGIALDISNRRNERRQKRVASGRDGPAERGSAQP